MRVTLLAHLFQHGGRRLVMVVDLLIGISCKQYLHLYWESVHDLLIDPSFLAEFKTLLRAD